MRLSRQNLVKALAIGMLLMFFLPVIAIANSEMDELNKLMKDVTEKRSTPDQLRDFEEKLIDNYGHAVPPDTIKRLVKEFTPGEALAIVACMRVVEKTNDEIINMRKSGMECDKISEKLNVNLENIIKRIKAFRRMGC
ncbi:MAG: hypothetical protein ACOYU2_01580 [Nitrospirota bacterium]